MKIYEQIKHLQLDSLVDLIEDIPSYYCNLTIDESAYCKQKDCKRCIKNWLNKEEDLKLL